MSMRPDSPINSSDIANLPKNAQAALAARCARRVVFMLHPKRLLRDNDITNEDLVRMIEQYASGSVVEIDPALIAEIAKLAERFHSTYADSDSGGERFGWVADCIQHGLACALQPAPEAAGSCAAAVRAAGVAAAWYQLVLEDAQSSTVSAANRDAAVEKLWQAVQYDYALLLRTVRYSVRDGKRTMVDSPITPEFFGPLWRDGEPPGWKSQPDRSAGGAPKKILLQVSLPEGVPPEEAESQIVQLITAMSELHAAHGGSGLTISDRRAWESSTQSVDVPQ